MSPEHHANTPIRSGMATFSLLCAVGLLEVEKILFGGAHYRNLIDQNHWFSTESPRWKFVEPLAFSQIDSKVLNMLKNRTAAVNFFDNNQRSGQPASVILSPPMPTVPTL